MNSQHFNTFPTIETERISLEQMQSEDVDAIYKFNSCKESLKYVVREPYTNIKQAQTILDYFMSMFPNKQGFWWIFKLKETGEKIGYGGLFDISPIHNKAEIGYGLSKEHWNNGYMSEILDAIIDFGINTLELHKIYGIVIPGNNASIKLLENNGFVKEAHLKDHSFGRGQYFDETIYSLINPL